ncbi:MAG: hypothetical protein HYZ53_31180 [Planctomycetes bacterium]|nr:hypothetical protein [Planctomycetota bacterium]
MDLIVDGRREIFGPPPGMSMAAALTHLKIQLNQAGRQIQTVQLEGEELDVARMVDVMARTVDDFRVLSVTTVSPDAARQRLGAAAPAATATTAPPAQQRPTASLPVAAQSQSQPQPQRSNPPVPPPAFVPGPTPMTVALPPAATAPQISSNALSPALAPPPTPVGAQSRPAAAAQPQAPSPWEALAREAMAAGVPAVAGPRESNRPAVGAGAPAPMPTTAGPAAAVGPAAVAAGGAESQALDRIFASVPTLMTMSVEAAAFYQQGDRAGGLERLQQASGVVDAIVSTVESVAAAHALELGRFQVRGRSIAQHIQSLKGMLGGARQKILSGNPLAVARLVEYDLAPTVEVWQAAILALRADLFPGLPPPVSGPEKKGPTRPGAHPSWFS